MTDAPPPPEASETPAVKAARKKRTRLQAIAFFGGIGVAVLAALVLVTAIGGRMYLLSDSGRGLVTSFVAGKKLGRYGRINVEGVRGDLFDDFTIDRVTVTDADGVWLEARKVRVDWNWWPLITRRFHATDVEAEIVRLIRRPLVEPSTEPASTKTTPWKLRNRSRRTSAETSKRLRPPRGVLSGRRGATPWYS